MTGALITGLVLALLAIFVAARGQGHAIEAQADQADEVEVPVIDMRRAIIRCRGRVTAEAVERIKAELATCDGSRPILMDGCFEIIGMQPEAVEYVGPLGLR